MANGKEPPKKKRKRQPLVTGRDGEAVHPHAAAAKIVGEMLRPYLSLIGAASDPHGTSARIGTRLAAEPDLVKKIGKNLIATKTPEKLEKGEAEIEALVGATPGLDIVQGVRDIVRSLREGSIGGALLNTGLTAMPFVGSQAFRSIRPPDANLERAAVRVGNRVFTGDDHQIASANAERALGRPIKVTDKVDGFSNSNGDPESFITRKEAERAVGRRATAETLGITTPSPLGRRTMANAGIEPLTPVERQAASVKASAALDPEKRAVFRDPKTGEMLRDRDHMTLIEKHPDIDFSEWDHGYTDMWGETFSKKLGGPPEKIADTLIETENLPRDVKRVLGKKEPEFREWYDAKFRSEDQIWDWLRANAGTNESQELSFTKSLFLDTPDIAPKPAGPDITVSDTRSFGDAARAQGMQVEKLPEAPNSELIEAAKKRMFEALDRAERTGNAADIERARDAREHWKDLQDTAFRTVDKNSEIAQAHAEFGGSTFDPRTGQNLAGSDRWAVATKTFELLDEEPTGSQIEAFRKKHARELAKPGREIGTWFDKENKRHGKHELNITETYPTQKEAEKVGRKRGEASILHLDKEMNFPEVDIEYTPKERIALRRKEYTGKAGKARLHREILDGLEPHERAYLEKRPYMLERVAEKYLGAPSPRQISSVIAAGGSQADWYDPVAQVLFKKYGKDAPRFAAMMGALSPLSAVEPNLRSAEKAWKEWVRLGRRTDDKTIAKVISAAEAMFSNPKVPGAKSTYTGNFRKLLRASQDELLNAEIGFLSGPKVDPFFESLMKESRRIVLDTHMAEGLGTGAKDVNVPARNLAISAAFRNAGRSIGEAGGPQLSPRQLQAAYWGTARAVRMAGKGPTAEAALRAQTQSGKIPLSETEIGKAIQQTPTFQQMMNPERASEAYVRLKGKDGTVKTFYGTDHPAALDKAIAEGFITEESAYRQHSARVGDGFVINGEEVSRKEAWERLGADESYELMDQGLLPSKWRRRYAETFPTNMVRWQDVLDMAQRSDLAKKGTPLFSAVPFAAMYKQQQQDEERQRPRGLFGR